MTNFKKYFIYFGLFFLFIVFSMIFGGLLPDIYWFTAAGYSSIFYKQLLAKIILWLVGFAAAFLFIFINIYFAKRFFEKNKTTQQNNNVYDFLNKLLGTDFFSNEKIVNITPKNYKFLTWAIVGIATIFSLGVAGTLAANWLKILAYFSKTSFDFADPLFNIDISFFVFALPVIKLLVSQVGALLFISTIGAAAFYLLSGQLLLWKKIIGQPKVHLSLLGFLFSAWIFLRLKISAYNLLFSERGVVFGAGFTDIFGQLFSIKVMLVATVVLAILFLINIRLSGLRLPMVGVVVLFVLSFTVGGIYPGIIQKFIVGPNELTKEEPYIAHNIKYTQKAYGLENIKQQKLGYKKNITQQNLRDNQDIVRNIRIWDPKPLKDTYKQIQEIRLYYDFNDVDIDRYVLKGKPYQLMLSARELNSEQLPVRAKNWINERLKYTHGYGVVANKVSEVTPEGLPAMIIKDIPPVSNLLKITRPEIYYGEKTNGYVVVNTKTKEFDYPQGDENKYNNYRGAGGVVLKNLFRKFIYAWKFSDFKLLISSYITKQSKVLYTRNIVERINKIAPFIHYDNDPYIVIRDDGSLVWIIDGYTISDSYPYSQKYNRQINYMRNAVKVVVNAYDGTVTFYKMPGDPIIETYAKVFPGIFKDIKELPVDLQKHLRYPEDLFRVQATMYRTYHMNDPKVFYNLEDLWQLPTQKYENNTVWMDPYYFYGKIPGQKQLSYMLAIPFTPEKKNNLISILTVNCDPANYGRLNLIQLPKQELIYGPMQIESRIDQDADISKEMTLWSQEGSNVIRANMLLIPIANSILYVEPIYLQATASKLPELKRIVLAQGNKIAMRQTFDEALSAVLSMAGHAYEHTIKSSLKELASRARQLYQEAQSAMQKGDWGNYGKSQQELKTVLDKMAVGKTE